MESDKSTAAASNREGKNSIWTSITTMFPARRRRLKKHGTRAASDVTKTSAEQLQPVPDHVPPSTASPDSSPYFRLSLKRLLELRGPPVTERHAADFMQMVHGDREDSIHRKYSAERGIARCTLQLRMLHDVPENQDTTNETASLLTALAAHQNDLAKATRDEIQAEEDVGVIRALLRSKGVAIPVTSVRGDRIPQAGLPIYPDEISNDEGEEEEEEEEEEAESSSDVPPGE